ncbi:MAG: hypothetical protein F9K27_15895 [Anaerolineae bacterium]|nr:MAG: hypothetical protein F9K27_15895 [Anaerolineae bacterium]
MSSKLLMPSHLSIFVTDPNSGTPVAHLPLYAEVTVPRITPVPPVNEIFWENLQGPIANFHLPDPQYVVDTALKALGASITSDGLHQLENDSDQAFELFTAMLEEVEEIRTATNREHISDIPPYELRSLMIAAFRRIGNEMGLGLVPENREQDIIWANPLGVLTTDHVGYASFDLKRLHPEVQIMLVEAIEARRNDPSVTSKVAIWIHPYGYDGKFDALSQARFAYDAIVARLPVKAHALPPALINLGPRALQNPSLTDWQLSPASFAASPHLLIGEDGTETLLPAPNLPLHEFHFYQTIRFTDNLDLPESDRIPSDLTNRVVLGIANDFQMAWYPLGHSLGQILYSLPLAPGESIKLAVIDWIRHDEAERTEDTSLLESLSHYQSRDRVISETVDAAIKEFQEGSSFMAGLAQSTGLSGVIGKFGVAAGLTGSLGGASSDSQGSRNISATTVQRLNDSITQASSAMREIQSTVVLQSVQSESEAIETRTVTNYNHSHTLTILYYEVLRHFRILTKLFEQRPVVLVKIHTGTLTELRGFNIPPYRIHSQEQNILENRRILEPVLLDQRHKEGFDALERIVYRRERAKIESPTEIADPGDKNFKEFSIIITTGGQVCNPDPSSGEFIDIRVRVEMLDGSKIELFANARPEPKTNVLNSIGSFCYKDVDETLTGIVDSNYQSINWREIDRLQLQVDLGGGLDDISFTHFIVNAHEINGELINLANLNQFFRTETATTLPLPIKKAPSPSKVVTPSEYIEDEVKKNLLIDHLRYHESYYERILLLNLSTQKREDMLNNLKFPDGTTALDKVENRVLDVIGGYMVFPCAKQIWKEKIRAKIEEQGNREDQDAPLPIDERLITLPTRGIFAEGKLGHNSVSEIIDDDRFWKWEEHPIPFEAPDINPVTPIQPQPQQISATPTAFPQSLVNIVNPTAAPDPSGLSAALSLLGTPNIFRDMSGREEVADLLKKLAEESVDIPEAANRAREIQTRYGTELDKNEKDLQARIVEAITRPTGTPAQTGQPEQQTSAQQEKQHLENQDKKLEIASKLPKQQRDTVRQHVTQEITKKKTVWTILFSSDWVGEIGQPMLASYSAKVVFGVLVDDVQYTIEQYTDEQIVWQVEHEKVPLSATFSAKQITPIDGSFQVTVPGMAVEDLHLVPKNYSIPLRTNAPKLPDEMKYTVNKIQVDPKSPILHFKGTATLKTKTVKIAVKVNGEGELTGEWGRDFEKEATIDIVKLAVKSTLKAATRIMIGGEAGIEGTFEILYLESYEVKQI